MESKSKIAEVNWDASVKNLFTLKGASNIAIFLCMLGLGHLVGSIVKDYIRKVATKYDSEVSAPPTEEEAPASDERKSVYLASVVISSLVYYLIIVSMAVFAFHLVGVAITGIIAWVGVFSVVIGFALQGFLQDVVSGIVMALTGKFRVNDLVTMADGSENRLYIIESFNLLNTTLRDLTSNAINKVSNRKLQESSVTNITLGKIYYVVYPVLVHNSNENFKALVDKVCKTIDTYPLVRDTKRRTTIGFDEVNPHGTKMSIRVPVLASQYNVEKENNLGVFVRDILKQHKIVFTIGSNPVS